MDIRFGRITHAAEYLTNEIGCSHCIFRRHHLQHVGLHAARLPCRLQPGHVIKQKFSRLLPCSNVGDIVLDGLKLADRLSEGLALHGIFKRIFKHAINSAEALRSEEHTSELQSLMRISYAVFCLKKKK